MWLQVSDVVQRDCLRVGVDQAGYGPLSRNREVRGVRDLPGTPGVAQGNTIHIEEASNLTNVWIHDNVCNNSMDTGGTLNCRIENNLVYGEREASARESRAEAKGPERREPVEAGDSDR